MTSEIHKDNPAVKLARWVVGMRTEHSPESAVVKGVLDGTLISVALAFGVPWMAVGVVVGEVAELAWTKIRSAR